VTIQAVRHKEEAWQHERKPANHIYADAHSQARDRGMETAAECSGAAIRSVGSLSVYSGVF